MTCMRWLALCPQISVSYPLDKYLCGSQNKKSLFLLWQGWVSPASGVVFRADKHHWELRCLAQWSKETVCSECWLLRCPMIERGLAQTHSSAAFHLPRFHHPLCNSLGWVHIPVRQALRVCPEQLKWKMPQASLTANRRGRKKNLHLQMLPGLQLHKYPSFC